jgi:hypothetical protein
MVESDLGVGKKMCRKTVLKPVTMTSTFVLESIKHRELFELKRGHNDTQCNNTQHNDAQQNGHV